MTTRIGMVATSVPVETSGSRSKLDTLVSVNDALIVLVAACAARPRAIRSSSGSDFWCGAAPGRPSIAIAVRVPAVLTSPPPSALPGDGINMIAYSRHDTGGAERPGRHRTRLHFWIRRGHGRVRAWVVRRAARVRSGARLRHERRTRRIRRPHRFDSIPPRSSRRANSAASIGSGNCRSRVAGSRSKMRICSAVRRSRGATSASRSAARRRVCTRSSTIWIGCTIKDRRAPPRSISATPSATPPPVSAASNSACAASTSRSVRRKRRRCAAIAHAATVLRAGRARAMITGGVDDFERMFFLVYDRFRALASDDGSGEASRPFDRRRNGFILGCGAFLVALESAGSARGPRCASRSRILPAGPRPPRHATCSMAGRSIRTHPVHAARRLPKRTSPRGT